MNDRPLRIVIAKAGLDGHDRGAKVIARALARRRHGGHLHRPLSNARADRADRDSRRRRRHRAFDSLRRAHDALSARRRTTEEPRRRRHRLFRRRDDPRRRREASQRARRTCRSSRPARRCRRSSTSSSANAVNDERWSVSIMPRFELASRRRRRAIRTSGRRTSRWSTTASPAKHGGEFILRIEDTDQARSTAESERAILETLRWCGLDWDEGPDVGGPHGPYRQSERSAIYREYAEKLLASGHAFKCFCTPQRLEEMRVAQRAAGQPSRYDGLCLHLFAGGESRVARPPASRTSCGSWFPTRASASSKTCAAGRSSSTRRASTCKCLVKSDGLPTYHLANVVDDHLMGITHVFRGEEWVSSAPEASLALLVLRLGAAEADASAAAAQSR